MGHPLDGDPLVPRQKALPVSGRSSDLELQALVKQEYFGLLLFGRCRSRYRALFWRI